MGRRTPRTSSVVSNRSGYATGLSSTATPRSRGEGIVSLAERAWSRGSARKGAPSSCTPSLAVDSNASSQAASSIPAGMGSLPLRARVERVADVIAPGGYFGEEREEAGASMYGTDFQGRRLLETGALSAARRGWEQVPHAATFDLLDGGAPRNTHDRCIAHEGAEGLRQSVQSTYSSSQPGAARLQRWIESARRAKGLTREEQEGRWRLWQQRQRQCVGGRGGEHDGASTAASAMPAGQRRAKCIDDIAVGGVMLPLFGEDRPTPLWTTLSSAPWVGRGSKREVGRPRSQMPPWLGEASGDAVETPRGFGNDGSIGVDNSNLAR